MLSEEILAILACPACKSRLELVRDRWLVCTNAACRRKYPIVEDIPNLLVEEGDKYVDVAVEDLPDPA